MITTAQAREMVLEDRKEAEFITFESKGQIVAGVLTGAGPAVITDKKTGAKKRVLKFTVERLDNKGAVSFLGTAQLAGRIRRDDLGKLIRVEYVDDRDTAGGSMMLFDVKVSADKVADIDPLTITDDDLPF